MKVWLRKPLLILGILLCISSARGIAADLRQVNPSWQDSTEEDIIPGPQSLNLKEQTDPAPLAQATAGRSLAISKAFLASTNGKFATLLPASTPQGDPIPMLTEPVETTTGSQIGSDPAEAQPARKQQRVPGDPTRIVVPAIHLDAPVVLSPVKTVSLAGKEFQQWAAPDELAAGWQEGSARLGEPGNTVINGHHNEYGEVFRYLVDLQPGDTIQMYAEDRLYSYTIANKMILPEKYQDIDVRMDNARWIMPSADERLTLITCWPYETNTHRLIIVAVPDLTIK